MTEIPTEQRLNERGALRLAGVAFVFCAVATAAFFVSYSTAASLASRPQPAQTAAAALTQAPATPDAFANVSLIAKSAIVIDIPTGRILYTVNPDAQLPLASLTKVAMALTVSEALQPGDTVVIPYTTTPTTDAPSLMQGERWRAADLLDYTLTASSNDGANILASAADENLRALYPEAPEGSATLWRMNDLAHQLGLTNTFFLNVNGLDLSATQAGAYGSARDVAYLLAYAASTSPQLFSATTHSSVRLAALSGQAVIASNTNEALPSIPGLVMGKTGYTDLAGGNLGVVFDVGTGHRVVAVVLGSTFDGRFTDIETLVADADRAFAD
jgi:D-alanyl-D-alanine carboxypeptidase